MSCSGTGYAGSLKVNSASLPYLNCAVNRIMQVNKPVLIGWGIDSKYRSPYNYNIAQSFIKGQFSTEVFNSGSQGTAFTNLVRAAIEGTEVDIDFSPGGGSGISVPKDGKCYIDSMTVQGSSAGIITASFSFCAADAESNSSGSSSNSFESAGLTDDRNPVPWYYANISMQSSGDDSQINNSAVSFSVTLANPADIIFALNGLTTPVDIRLGTMQVAGSIGYFSSDADFNDLENGANLSIDVGPVNIKMPHLVFTNTGETNSGRNDPIVRNISFESFGFESQKAIYLG